MNNPLPGLNLFQLPRIIDNIDTFTYINKNTNLVYFSISTLKQKNTYTTLYYVLVVFIFNSPFNFA